MRIKCPQCNKVTEYSGENSWRPFCSERCKLIDLGAWIEGKNYIPGEASTTDAASEPSEIKH